MPEQASLRSVIKNSGFINLWVNQILVQFAYNSLNFALIIWVYRLTGSNVAVSLLLCAAYAPAVVFGLFAGVLVDSLDRRKIIIVIDLLLALAFFSLLFTKDYYVAILITTFFINSLAQFYIPSEASMIPVVCKKNQLLQANSLFTMTLQASFLAGFGLAGPIIGFFGIDLIFKLESGALFLAFVLALWFPKVAIRQNPSSRQVYAALKGGRMDKLKQISLLEIKQTIALIRGKLPLSAAIAILTSVQAMIGILGVLIPSFLERVLQIDATNASYVLIAPLGAGMLLGGFTLGKLGHLFTRRGLVGRAIVVIGLMLFLIGIAPLVSPAIQYFPKPKPLPFFHQPSLSTIMVLGSFLAGLAMVSIFIPSQTVIQEYTPEGDRGKVFSVLGTLMSAFSLIPVIFAGALADLFGPMPIFIGLGGAISIVGWFALKPDFFFEEHHLPQHVREFLGLGHWAKRV